MSFILIEHEKLPIRVKGKKVILATISVIDIEIIVPGTYIELSNDTIISLINLGGFLSVAPEMKEAYYLANIIPATLSEAANKANDGEIFVSADTKTKILKLVAENNYEDQWPDFLQGFWIPSKFYIQDSILGYGWFNKGDSSSKAIVIDIDEEIKSCISVSALRSEKVKCNYVNFKVLEK